MMKTNLETLIENLINEGRIGTIIKLPKENLKGSYVLDLGSSVIESKTSSKQTLYIAGIPIEDLRKSIVNQYPTIRANYGEWHNSLDYTDWDYWFGDEDDE